MTTFEQHKQERVEECIKSLRRLELGLFDEKVIDAVEYQSKRRCILAHLYMDGHAQGLIKNQNLTNEELRNGKGC